MPIGNWNLEWLNHNSQRSYPFVSWGDLQDTTASITIPNDFIVALNLPVHAGMAVTPDKFYMQNVGIYPTGYSLSIGYNDADNNYPVVATVNIARDTHTEYRSYTLEGYGDFDDSVGTVVIGKLDNIDTLPAGSYNFDPENTTIETDAIRPMIRGVSSITTVNGTDRSDKIYGDIELVAGTNMRIVANIVEGQTPQIIFSAIEGEGLNEECGCDDEETGTPIRFINGIPPLVDGNFRMVGDKCLDIQPMTNGLQLLDKCSEPCCGCEELDALVRRIDRFADGAFTLQTFINNLGGQVTQMGQVVLGSKLADQGCVDC